MNSKHLASATEAECTESKLAKKKKYATVYNEAYTNEFPSILPSRKGMNYVFCNVCCVDFSILHKGRGDITKHIARDKHQIAVQAAEKSKKIDANFLQKDDDFSVIRAESFFTAYLVEHNLAISSADHMAPLFKKMFPDSKIAKKYGCARTKTTAIIAEMAKMERNEIVKNLKKVPFSIATDGSNKADKKLFPIVVSYFNEDSKKVETSLLSVPVLEGDSSGQNISRLILDVLNSFDVPFANCISLGTDNAPVMIGKNAGVASFLLKEMPHLFVQGCLCHLIDLAAEKGAACLPTDIEASIIDIYYFLEKSVKRKEKLKMFQQMHDLEVRKILKHVSTRWLSLNRCLKRLSEQWDPLTAFFREEAQNVLDASTSKLKFYRIPKIHQAPHSIKTSDAPAKKDVSAVKKECRIPKKIRSSPKTSTDKNQSKTSVVNQNICKKRSIRCESSKTKKVKLSSKEILSREERLFLFLSSDINKAFVNFLLNTLPIFEEYNVVLQSKESKIHILKTMLMEMFKHLLSRFVVPSAIKNSPSLLDVDYHARDNQKLNNDMMIGQAAFQIISTVSEKKKTEFYDKVRDYYVTVCDYMRLKFPFSDDVLINAEVSDLDRIDKMSFDNVKYFIKRFPAITKFLGNNEKTLLDELQSQFCSVQIEEIPISIKSESRMDVKWMKLNDFFEGKYTLLSRFMVVILTLPHSNAECERIFSYVTKTLTQFRSQLSTQTLENLITVKSNMVKSCYEQNFDNVFLKKAKSATTIYNNSSA